MEKVKSTEKFSSVKFSHEGKVLEFRIDEIVLPDGKKAEREYIRHKGAVAVIPVDSEGFVYLVRQYRYAAGKELLEIPAGKLDSAEEVPLLAAKRELREETGLIADELIYIGEYMGSPAINNEIIHLYFARGLTQSEQELDEDEFLSVEKMPLCELCSMVMNGEISDGKTAYAALWAEKYIRESNL